MAAAAAAGAATGKGLAALVKSKPWLPFAVIGGGAGLYVLAKRGGGGSTLTTAVPSGGFAQGAGAGALDLGTQNAVSSTPPVDQTAQLTAFDNVLQALQNQFNGLSTQLANLGTMTGPIAPPAPAPVSTVQQNVTTRSGITLPASATIAGIPIGQAVSMAQQTYLSGDTSPAAFRLADQIASNPVKVNNQVVSPPIQLGTQNKLKANNL